MASKVIVHKGRTNVVRVNLGMNITGDTFTSEIRSEPDVESALLGTWVVTVSDATKGELVLTLDDITTAQIKATSGFMDLKRVTGSEPVAVFDRPLEVTFRGTVTA